MKKLVKQRNLAPDAGEVVLDLLTIEHVNRADYFCIGRLSRIRVGTASASQPVAHLAPLVAS